jgi:ABC-2 type transport system permease protein
MTASITARAAAPASVSRFAGLGSLLRKERTEWFRGRRAWVVMIVTTVSMVLSASVAWFNTTMRAAFPSPDAPPAPPLSMDPLDNLLAAIGFPIFTFVAILAVAGLVSRERESGTLAWVASKPVTRSAIWLAKWAMAAVTLGVMVAVVPLAITAALVAGMYGMPDVALVSALGFGMVATVVFYAAVVLAISTVLSSQAAVAGVAIGITFLPNVVGLIPLPLTQLLPDSILPWAGGLASGADVGFVTPLAWLAGTAAVVVYGMLRTERLEL